MTPSLPPTQEYIDQECAAAEWLSLQARGAAAAGNHARANELRDQFDAIYDRLEALLEHL